MVKFIDVLRVPCSFLAVFRGIFALGLLFSAISYPLSAQAAPKYAGMVLDANSGRVLYKHKADELRYPASLTKMMTLYLVFQELKKGNISLSTKFVASEYASKRPPSKIGLKKGQKITVINAIRALVTKSANDVAVTVAENIAGTESQFAEEMTKVARSLGMKNTLFKNASGLPNSRQVTTARDMIKLSVRLHKDFPQYFHFFKTKYFHYRGKRYGNHNRLLYGFHGVEGIKTGYTRASGFNLTTSYRRKGKHLIAVVMGHRSSKQRNAKMRRLLKKYVRKASVTKKKKRRLQPVKQTPVIRTVDARIPPNVRIVQVKTINLARVTPEPKARAVEVPKITEPVVRTKPSSKVYTDRLPSEQLEQGDEPPAQGRGPRETHQEKIAEAVPDQEERVRKEPVEEPKQPKNTYGPFHIQVGAFSDMNNAKNRLAKVSTRANDLLRGHPALTLEHNTETKNIIRARFASFSQRKARSTCRLLKRRSISCIVLRAE